MINDLGFLILFIILPTVLIVSGFWLILIVRSDLRLRAAPEASMQADEATAEVAEPNATAVEAGLPAPAAAKLPIEPPAPQLAQSLPEAPSLEAASAIEADDDEDFWTPETAAAGADAPQVEEPAPAPEPSRAQPAEHLNDTANLPDEWEVDLDAESDASQATCDDDEPRLQRQPAARMVPSTEHVRRRTGPPPRRAPTVVRSSVRDEDAVESPDGG